jgi:hypothetical protein
MVGLNKIIIIKFKILFLFNIRFKIQTIVQIIQSESKHLNIVSLNQLYL